jgi:HD-GYP domain-containing protein (c-di-GMP phosphodiesterase class II)/uncharacterized membrane protein
LVIASTFLVVALASVSVATLVEARYPPLVTTALLAAAALIVERRRVALSGRLTASASYLPIVLALVICGALGGVIVSAVSILAQLSRPYVRWLVWTCTNAIAASVAGLAVLSLGEPSRSIQGLALAAVVAGACMVIASLVLATLTLAARAGPWRQIFRAGWTLIASAMAVYVPMVAALAYAYERMSIWALVIALPPIVAAQQLLALYRQQTDTAHRLAQAVQEAEATNERLESANNALAAKNRELEEANLSFAASLIVSLDARDHYTAGHSAAVAVYSRDVAREVGLSEDQQRRAYLAGLMHDIGKVGLPPGILEKAEALSPEEEELMKQHVLIGERILSPVRLFGSLAPAVRHHHERFDGEGYPDGLSGREIPVLARLVAVADAYNAMTSDRPYRSALAPLVAISQLRSVAGTQLDPVFATAFAGLLTIADPAYQVARRSEFFIDFERLADTALLSTALAGV